MVSKFRAQAYGNLENEARFFETVIFISHPSNSTSRATIDLTIALEKMQNYVCSGHSGTVTSSYGYDTDTLAQDTLENNVDGDNTWTSLNPNTAIMAGEIHLFKAPVSAAEGLSLANCANSSGVRFTLFKNPSNFLSYGSLVAVLLIAAENNSKLSPLSKDLSIFPALKFLIWFTMTNRALSFSDSAQNRCGFSGSRTNNSSKKRPFDIRAQVVSFKVFCSVSVCLSL